MFEFCIGNHEVFGSLTQNCLQLYKDKSTASTFSVILTNKYVVITIQKISYVESFSFDQGKGEYLQCYVGVSGDVPFSRVYFLPKNTKAG